MGTRHLSLALIVAATLLAGRALAQESGLPPQEEQALERAQFVERYDAFLTAWEEAGDEARERVLALFDAEERFARELDPLPASDQVVHGTRLLRGERTGPLSRFADALALRLIPGVLEAEEPSDRPRNPLRVVIYRRWEEAVPESARLVLWQLGPRGEVERLRDKALSDGFFDDGLEVWIVRAPRSAPGRYSYVLEVHGEEGAVRTPPTPLEVVADLEERSKRVEDPRRRRDLARLLSFGVRLPGGVEPLLGERPSSERELPGARTLVSGSASAPVVLLVAGEGERPEELLSGERGERWRDAARGGGFDVVCVALEQVVGASLGATLAALRGEDAERPVLLVVRGAAARVLPVSFAASPEARIDGFVLSGSLRPGGALPRVPTLVLRPTRRRALDRWELDEDLAHVRVEAGAPYAFLAELRLPEAVAGFLGALVGSESSD